jgi:carbonic anhydrase/acetyltransferase-like protein (isoleucine patch superfamily)
MKKFELRDDVRIGSPSIDASVFVARGAQIIGDVVIGEGASVWYNCVLRGDINRISIGKRSNIQDGTVIHLENDLGCSVGDDVTVGHRAILHGCTIEDGALIGMGAIVLNGAVIGKGAIVGAGAVVKEGMQVPPCTLVVGVPAKIVKSLPASTYETNVQWAEKYVRLAKIHAETVH